MARSLWKGPFVDGALLKSTQLNSKIWSRRSCILPQFVGSFTQIYNGRIFIGLKITEDMVGHKFGEFVSTRKTLSLRRINLSKRDSSKRKDKNKKG